MKESARAREEQFRNESLKAALDRSAAIALAGLMSDISESYYCASWLSGLENSLWPMIHDGSRKFGFGEVSAEEIDQLRELHQKCGGWWFYDDERGGEMFINTDEWLKLIKIHE